MSARRPMPSNVVPVPSILDRGSETAIQVWNPDKFVGNVRPLIALSSISVFPILTIEDVEQLVEALQKAVKIAKGNLEPSTDL